MIDETQLLQAIETGNWCSFSFCKAHKAKKKGGEVVHIKKARLAKQRPDGQSFSRGAASGNAKNVNHHQHFIRNFELANKMIISVHIDLIFHFNGHPVL